MFELKIRLPCRSTVSYSVSSNYPGVGQTLAWLPGQLVGPDPQFFIAHNEDFAAAFNFKVIWELFLAAPAEWIIAFLGALLASLVASLGVIACVVGVFMTMAYAVWLQGIFTDRHSCRPRILAARNKTGFRPQAISHNN